MVVDGAAMTVMVGVSSAIGGAVLYVIRAEVRKDRETITASVTLIDSKQKAHEAECAQRQRLLDERHKTILHELAESNARGQRMEDKLDRIVGAGT